MPEGLLQPSRRTVLGLTYAAALAAASACGLRLDLPEPPPPVPTRRLVPDEALLIDLVRHLEDLVSRTEAVNRPGRSARTIATLDGLLSEQLEVVTGRLTNDGVPTEVIRPTPVSPTAAPPGTQTGTTPAPEATTPRAAITVAALAESLTELEARDWATLAAASAGNRELVLSARSVHLAGGTLLGAELPFAAQAAPARPRLVERTAPLVYGFEVVAAQSAGSARTRALTARDEAADLLHALGGTSATAPGGWALPFPVTTAKEAARLAQHLLGTAIAATTTVAGDATDAKSLEEVGRWSGRVQALAARWGLPLTAFPGMGA